MSDEKSNKIINYKIIIWCRKNKRILIGLATIILITLIIIFIDFYRIVSNIVIIGFWGLFLFVITYTIAFLIRAYKLKLIFKGLNCSIRFNTSFFSNGANFFINDLTLGRVGEIAKMYIIKDQEQITSGETIAGISIERLLDFIIIFIISIFALLFLYINNPKEIRGANILGQNIQFFLILGVITIIFLLVIFLIFLYKNILILKIIKKISPNLALYIAKFLENLKENLERFKNNKMELIFTILLTFPTYIIDAFIVVIFFYVLGYNLNLIIIILATIILFLSRTFSITPGGWAISENIGALFIYLFYPHIPFVEILSIFIIDHLFRSIYIFFYGGYSLFHYNIKLKDAHEKSTLYDVIINETKIL